MYFRALIGISALALCSGDSSNQAISSVNFHRYDVPLSYKYSYIHTYTTEKPNSRTNEAYRNIQYAPIEFSTKDNKKYEFLYNTAILSKSNKKENLTKNEYLEPKVQDTGINYNNSQFAAGYNIDTPKLNNIDYNNINLEYKNIAMHNREMNKLSLHANAESIPTSHHDSFKSYNNLNQIQYRNVLDTRQHEENRGKSIQGLTEVENTKIKPVFNPYVKVPRLYLNVARGYSYPRSSVDTPTNGNRNTYRIQNKQPNIKQIKTPLIQKTFIFPWNEINH